MTFNFNMFRLNGNLDGRFALSVDPVDPVENDTFYLAPSTLGIDSREPQGESTLPDIQVTGATADRDTITISTSTLDFGVAPTVYLDWTGEDDTIGQLMDPQPSNGGQLGAAVPSNSFVVDEGVGASRSFYAAKDGSLSYLRWNLPDITTAFAAFKYKNNNKWPGGSGWPNEQGEDFVVPRDSAWKMIWIGANPDDIASGANSNLCIPTHGQKQALQVGGNSHQMSAVSEDLGLFATFGDWSTVETFIRPDPAALNGPNGYGVLNLTSPNQGRKHQEFSGTVFDPNNTDTSWKRINFAGWIDVYNELQILYSELYVADIPSRVVIGDHSELSKCRYTSTCGTQSWSSTSITATLRVPHDKDTNLYLYVMDADGRALSQTGVPIMGGNI